MNCDDPKNCDDSQKFYLEVEDFEIEEKKDQSLEVEQLDALQGQEFGEALENGNKTFLISPENVKPASKIAHISLDHDYEETCQNMKKNHKEKIKETLTNEVIDGRNYELVIRNGKEKFRCRLCPFPFLFGQISDLSRHIAIFHEGKIPPTNLVENETKEKIETECLNVQQTQEFEEALKHDFIISNDTESQQLEVQQAVPIYIVPHTPHCARLSLLKRSQGEDNENVNSVHNRNKPVQCSLCHKIFSEQFYLRMHFINVHQGKKFIMPQFPREVKSSINLVQEGKKKAQCLYCQRVIGQKRNLKRHISTVHERKRPFQCNICSSKFGSKQERKRHIQVIHDESQVTSTTS